MDAEGADVDVEWWVPAPTVFRKTIRVVDCVKRWPTFGFVSQEIGTFRGTHDFYLNFDSFKWRANSSLSQPKFSILMKGPSEVSCAATMSVFNGTKRWEMKQADAPTPEPTPSLGGFQTLNTQSVGLSDAKWTRIGNPGTSRESSNQGYRNPNHHVLLLINQGELPVAQRCPTDNMVFKIEVQVADVATAAPPPDVAAEVPEVPEGPEGPPLPAPAVTAPPRNPLVGLAEQLGDLFESSELSDMVLRVDGRELRVHSAILAAHSPVFRTMFQSGVAEKTTRIVMKDTDFDTAQLFCRFLYTGSLDKLDEASTDDVLSLLKLAKTYDVVVLQENLVEPLIEKLSSANCVKIFAFAAAHNLPSLAEAALQFATADAARVAAVMQTPDYAQLDPEHFKLFGAHLQNNQRSSSGEAVDMSAQGKDGKPSVFLFTAQNSSVNLEIC
eukprot:Selendium_serpulae@DN6488_c0_g2_i1.p1